MALVLTRKPAILLENDDDYRKIIFEGKTITKSLFADIENCAEFTKVTIPENVEGVRGDAFGLLQAASARRVARQNRRTRTREEDKEITMDNKIGEGIYAEFGSMFSLVGY